MYECSVGNFGLILTLNSKASVCLSPPSSRSPTANGISTEKFSTCDWFLFGFKLDSSVPALFYLEPRM